MCVVVVGIHFVAFKALVAGVDNESAGWKAESPNFFTFYILNFNVKKCIQLTNKNHKIKIVFLVEFYYTKLHFYSL